MLIGVLSDIHGNCTALQAVLEDMEDEVDEIVCVGDASGYGPRQKEVVQWLIDNDIPTVQGNHDRNINTPVNYLANGMAYNGLKHGQETMTEEQQEWLQNLPLEYRHEDIVFRHEHPNDDYLGTARSYVRPSDFPEMDEYLDEYDADLLVMGHTHVQGLEILDNGTVMNPGSVGQPRDDDWRAAYALLNTEDGSVELRRVEYDVDATIERIQEAGLPERTGTRLKR